MTPEQNLQKALLRNRADVCMLNMKDIKTKARNQNRKLTDREFQQLEFFGNKLDRTMRSIKILVR